MALEFLRLPGLCGHAAELELVRGRLATFTATNTRPQIWRLLQEDLAVAAKYKHFI